MKKNTKERRIWSRKEIASLLRTGRRQRCEGFTVIYKKSDHPYDRMAVIVSKKHGNAVKRNRIKRLVREAYRSVKQDGPPYYSILIRPKTNDSDNFHAIKEAYQAWRKSKIK